VKFFESGDGYILGSNGIVLKLSAGRA